jgi:protein tyrosine/serine phosphatase
MLRTACLLLLLTHVSWAADADRPHIRNFGQVTDHLFRGGEPTPEALQELHDLGVKTVIDLREQAKGTLAEKVEVEKLGLKYVNVPLHALTAPKPAEVQYVLSLIFHEEPSKPIYVHCWRGKDRTGTIIACYRIQHDGWDNRRALDEAKSFGMSSFEHSMQSFILHFTPVVIPEVLKAGN